MKKFHKLAALGAAFALTLSFTTVAYAAETDNPANATVPSSPAAASDSSVSSATSTPGTSNPFTPAGTGTVVNTATDTDGKEFYTITTPDKNVFYLIIDRQRDGDNVYFLDAVTEKDLLALAQKSGDTSNNSKNSVSEPENKPDTTSTTQTPETTTAQKSTTSHSNNLGMLLLVLAVVVIGGGAGYYFKIYRPKHQKAESEDDFNYGEENGPDEAKDAEQSDELPQNEGEDENGGDDEA